jgi:hypothetical protein
MPAGWHAPAAEIHDGAGQRGTGPAECEADAEDVVQENADRTARAEPDQQHVADHDRRQYQWQVDQRVQQRLARKPPARQQPAGCDAERQAAQ